MSYKEIMNSIKKNEIKKIYLFFGEEAYLVNNVLEVLKKNLIDPSFEQLNFAILEGKEMNINKIIDACETLPFMADRKLIYVKDLDLFSGKSKIFSEQEEKLMVEYIKEIPESTTIVFYGFATIDSRKKIVKEIKKYGDVVEFTKFSEEDLNKWIKKIFKSHGKSIGSKELTFLKGHLDYLGKNSTQNLYDVENDLNKIIGYMGAEENLKEEHIEKVLSSNFQNDIFKLMDAIEKRDATDAIKRLNYILDDGEPILKVLTTLGNQIKHILSAKLLLDEGYSSKMIASKLGIHPFVASKCASQSRRFTVDELKGLLNKFLDVDLMIKTGKMNDKMAIEMLVIEICMQ